MRSRAHDFVLDWTITSGETGANGDWALLAQGRSIMQVVDGGGATDNVEESRCYTHVAPPRMAGLPTRRSVPVTVGTPEEDEEQQIELWLCRGNKSIRLTPEVGLQGWGEVTEPHGDEQERRLQLYAPEADVYLVASAPNLLSDDEDVLRHTYAAFDQASREVLIRMGRQTTFNSEVTLLSADETLAYFAALLTTGAIPPYDWHM